MLGALWLKHLHGPAEPTQLLHVISLWRHSLLYHIEQGRIVTGNDSIDFDMASSLPG